MKTRRRLHCVHCVHISCKLGMKVVKSLFGRSYSALEPAYFGAYTVQHSMQACTVYRSRLDALEQSLMVGKK